MTRMEKKDYHKEEVVAVTLSEEWEGSASAVAEEEAASPLHKQTTSSSSSLADAIRSKTSSTTMASAVWVADSEADSEANVKCREIRSVAASEVASLKTTTLAAWEVSEAEICSRCKVKGWVMAWAAEDSVPSSHHPSQAEALHSKSQQALR